MKNLEIKTIKNLNLNDATIKLVAFGVMIILIFLLMKFMAQFVMYINAMTYLSNNGVNSHFAKYSPPSVHSSQFAVVTSIALFYAAAITMTKKYREALALIPKSIMLLPHLLLIAFAVVNVYLFAFVFHGLLTWIFTGAIGLLFVALAAAYWQQIYSGKAIFKRTARISIMIVVLVCIVSSSALFAYNPKTLKMGGYYAHIVPSNTATNAQLSKNCVSSTNGSFKCWILYANKNGMYVTKDQQAHMSLYLPLNQVNFSSNNTSGERTQP